MLNNTKSTTKLSYIRELAASFFGHLFGYSGDVKVGEVWRINFPKKPAANRVLAKLGRTKVIELW